jgi:hypothetical protein
MAQPPRFPPPCAEGAGVGVIWTYLGAVGLGRARSPTRAPNYLHTHNIPPPLTPPRKGEGDATALP